ncbi:MAG: hypothetical protein OXH69_02140 [Acidobacteria bacterium]|nr:hypothetical protein [Acidobacteriota bacterium]MCY4075822.1 hypothetical protein [Acidobacteriota bacterium]
MLRWIVLGTVVWWIGRTALDGLRRAANRPPPPRRRFDTFTLIAIAVVLLWALPIVVPLIRDLLQ